MSICDITDGDYIRMRVYAKKLIKINSWWKSDGILALVSMT